MNAQQAMESVVKALDAARADERAECAKEVWKARRPSCVDGCMCAFCLMLREAASAIMARAIQRKG